MSANNWTICPKCAEKNARRLNEVKASYGTVPAEEYLSMVKAATEEELESNLREDYEVGVYRGKFGVSYHAECAACFWTFSYRHEEKI